MVCATGPALDRKPHHIFCDSREGQWEELGLDVLGLPSGPFGLFWRVGREDRRGVTTEHDRIEDAAHWMSRRSVISLMRHGSQRSRSCFETDAPMGDKAASPAKEAGGSSWTRRL